VAGDDTNVIDFDAARSALEDTPIRSVQSSWCSHTNVTIDSNKRTLTCRKCKADVDPFAYLVGLSRDWDRYAFPLERVKKELHATHDKLADTKRQERNARARLKRLEKRLQED
jgi:hypothetical protein